MNKAKIIAIMAGVLVIVGTGYFIAVKRRATTPTQEMAQAEKIEYSGQDGKSVCDILKENHQVESTESSFGEMVNSIDGLVATDSEFWLYSINGEMGEVACDQQLTSASDQITWEYKGM